MEPNDNPTINPESTESNNNIGNPLTITNGNLSMEVHDSTEPDSTTSGYEFPHSTTPRNGDGDATTLTNGTGRGGGTNGSSDFGIRIASSGVGSGVEQAEALLSQLESLDDLNRLIQQTEGVGGVATMNLVDGQQHEYELPRSLIVTNLDSRIFTEGTPERAQFEDTFREVDQSVTFLFFKSFRRARVDFAMSLGATKARILCNQRRIGEETINCYYAEVCEIVSNMLLRPPALEKQFLISPPASPPEGWQPSEEAQPCLNFDLQSALAQLIPGSTHELHPASESQPGIVVHIGPDTTTVTSGPLDVPNVVVIEGEEVPDGYHQNDVVDGNEIGGNGSGDGFGPMMMGRIGGGTPMGGMGLGMGGGVSRKIPQTACPPSMMSSAASGKK